MKVERIDFKRWAVVEWECYLKHAEDGARESVQFVNDHLIQATEMSFDAFMRPKTDPNINRRILNID